MGLEQIAMLLGAQANRNASEGTRYSRQGQKDAQGWGMRSGDNMVYSQAPQMDRSNSDTMTPASVVGNIGDMGMPGSSSGAKMIPVIGQAIQAEKDIYAPTEAASSGYQVGPQNSIENVMDRFKQIYGRIYR